VADSWRVVSGRKATSSVFTVHSKVSASPPHSRRRGTPALVSVPRVSLRDDMPVAMRAPGFSSLSSRRPDAVEAARSSKSYCRRASPNRRVAKVFAKVETHTTDVVVIGGGIGGLCAGALCALYGKKVTVVESHSVAGGAAHSWKRNGYTFESGPSLYSGMSKWPTTNPCGQVLHALDEPLTCVEYNTWMVHVPEGSFLTEVGNDQFVDVLREYVADVDGVNAADEWLRLKELMKPLAKASSALPPSAVRTDLGAVVTLARFVPGLLAAAPVLPEIMAPYSKFMEKNDIRHPFVKNWMEVLCFLLSGAPASGTLAAEIGYMFDDWYKPNSTLEFPVGGSEAIVDALTRGLRKNGGRLEVNSHVAGINFDDATKRATGVTLKDGTVITATESVISNCTVWDTLKILPPNAMEECRADGSGKKWVDDVHETKMCASFMHLHLGIDATGLPPDLEIHHIYVEDWARGVTAEQNMVLVSIASVLDPTLAPTGKHVIHAYTPGNEPVELWQGLERGSDEYEKLKDTRSQILWRAVEKAIPDVRVRVECQYVGSPLTQQRWQRRHKGTYGGTGWITPDSDTIPITTAATPMAGLLVVGDSNFPGPGVPSVAAHGWSAAHELVPFWKQCAMLDKVAP
jgi:phytoene dehydrogenase-like protein|tara:strand:- start:2284 stop:4173 length:1890 start_codon:yes stop_codon:yes gene_type:complete